MKQKLIPIILSVTLAVLCTVSIVDAQAGLAPLTAYTQNFDSLANSGTSSALPTGWAFSESGTNANTMYTAGTGSGNAGDTYSFGPSGGTDRKSVV